MYETFKLNKVDIKRKGDSLMVWSATNRWNPASVWHSTDTKCGRPGLWLQGSL